MKSRKICLRNGKIKRTVGQVSNHADVNRASTSAMRERTPMQEQRKYAENSPKRKRKMESLIFRKQKGERNDK
ncbi:MAG: hypothetical protein ACLUB7_02990 [Coprococcus phoceensis]